MATIESLTTAIHAALDKARDLLAGLAGSRSQAESLHDEMRGLGFHNKAARSEGIASDLETAQAQTMAIAARLESALAAVESARTGSGVLGGGNTTPDTHSRAVPDRPPWADRPPIAGFTFRRPVRECYEAIREAGWPRNAQGQTSARAILYTSDGHRVNAEMFRPHRPGQTSPSDDLREPWRSDERYTTTWHVERDAAAEVRRWGLTDSVLYLNIPPCGEESGDPFRCHANLEKLLPAGVKMFVWAVNEDGSRTRRRYVGTGEAIHE
jgi:hypothetical protein